MPRQDDTEWKPTTPLTTLLTKSGEDSENDEGLDEAELDEAESDEESSQDDNDEKNQKESIHPFNIGLHDTDLEFKISSNNDLLEKLFKIIELQCVISKPYFQFATLYTNSIDVQKSLIKKGLFKTVVVETTHIIKKCPQLIILDECWKDELNSKTLDLVAECVKLDRFVMVLNSKTLSIAHTCKPTLKKMMQHVTLEH